MGSKKEVYGSRLADVPAEKVFCCYGGGEFKNLSELTSALSEMPETTFEHHVTQQNNDFSNWVRDVIGDTTLAKTLNKSADRIQAHLVAKERLTWLQARA
jgi:hypothetical protein